MKTIFDAETEIGSAPPELWGWEGGDLPNVELLDGRFVAHTRADLNRARGILKLEQRIYIRAGEHVLEQDWIHPEVLIESVEDDGEQALNLAQSLHEHFCENARQRLSEGICAPAF
jgi:hypothetical protein